MRGACDERRRVRANDEYRRRMAVPVGGSGRSCAAESERWFIVRGMVSTVAQATPHSPAPMLGWPRVRVVLVAATLVGLLLGRMDGSPTLLVVARSILVGVGCLLAFGLFERWPRRLPIWLPRSALQIVGIALAVPIFGVIAFLLTAGAGLLPEESEHRRQEFGALLFLGLLLAPWIGVGALLKQRDLFAREQALAFELERSELERQALDARLRLLQAQVEPHFLFNTLANVQALVDAGSPQASKVLASLIAYLRAAVPRLHESSTTLGQEADLVRAYLELMQMRMPDRLQFALRVDPAARELQCPPMTLLTLVENAVRHGIDPSEIGGRIDIDISLRDSRCVVRVSDTGVGLKEGGERLGTGLGTGLSTLRERMQLAFGAEAQLRLREVAPHGVCAELEFPAKRSSG